MLHRLFRHGHVSGGHAAKAIFRQAFGSRFLKCNINMRQELCVPVLALGR